MLYHLTLILNCDHPIYDFGEIEIASLSDFPSELKDRAVGIMREKYFNFAYIVCRKVATGKISRYVCITDFDNDAFLEKPRNPDDSRPNIDNSGLTENIRTALWNQGNIFYLDDLRDWERKHVQKIRGIGPKFFAELEAKLSQLGIRFKGD